MSFIASSPDRCLQARTSSFTQQHSLNANRLHKLLSSLDDLSQKQMTQNESYYLAKEPERWPWQTIGILTPTPPDTPVSEKITTTSERHIEVEIEIEIESQKDKKDIIRPLYKDRIKPSIFPTNKNTEKRTGIRKRKDNNRDHFMITRSKCKGSCCLRKQIGRR